MQLLKPLVFCFFIAGFSAPLLLRAQAVNSEDYSVFNGVYAYKKDSAVRSKFESHLSRRQEKGRIFYDIVENGAGDYDKYEDITWYASALIEEKQGTFYLLESKRVIKDESGKVTAEFSKVFDYENQKIHCRSLNSKEEPAREITFQLKGLTTDDNTIAYFLTAYLSRQDKENYRDFYLVTHEPGFYRISIKVVGRETLKLDDGEAVKAVKIRLVPDFGFLTGFYRLMVPATYFWFRDDATRQWLKYEGLETGVGSTHVVSYLSK